MARMIDAATGDLKALPVQFIDVPEWPIDGQPARIYWRPLNLLERAKLFGDGGALQLAAYADVLIDKALDEKGEKLFTLADKQLLLRNVDSGVIARIALTIIAGPDREAIEKN